MAKPTHTLYVKRKGENYSRQVGVGWMNEKGWITLRLNLCAYLIDRDDVFINLYPVRSEPVTQEEEDIPFGNPIDPERSHEE